MKTFFSENNVFSTYYTFFPKIKKMIQSIKNRFNTYYTFIYKKIITINNNKRGAKKGSAYS